MGHIYKISTATRTTTWVFAFFILIFFFVLQVTSGYDWLSILKIETLVAIFALFFPALFSFIYIAVDNQQLSFPKWGFFRVTVPIEKVVAVSLRPSLVGATKNIDIEYTDSTEKMVHITIGTFNAFGKRNIAKIVEHLTNVNPSIKVDRRLVELLKI